MSAVGDGTRTVRTRIAPSPTGDPHVGTAYVALVNLCFAKAHGGAFILRVEDTDRARSTLESEWAILDALRWLELRWDEGPDIGGPYGPYRQSERSAIYREHAELLLKHGDAFRCFCTPERLAEVRETQRLQKTAPRYDGYCLRFSPEESRARAEREPYVVRMKVPDEGKIEVHDALRGTISFDLATVDMQVLLKSDGLPTYHLANVVDDHLMRITHVIRGEEWISSAPKHLLLYRYFAWQAPELAHLPLLRNPDKSKLSKRKNPTGILFYRAMGYLPGALLNFLALLMGTPPQGDDEIITLQTAIERFKLAHVSLGGPVFDVGKLDWLNGQWLRRLSLEGFTAAFDAWVRMRASPAAVGPLVHSRVERLSDVVPLAAFLYAGRVAVSRDALVNPRLDETTARRALAVAMWRLDAEASFERLAIERVLKAVADELGRKLRDLARTFYVAITGSPTSIPLFDAMELLGRDICRERLRHALGELGGVSKSEEQAWRAAAPAVPEPA
ncbi:MAG: glutamate--tRNA ligase [Candidatus Eremiobacteraeota bacterium]|nr:glutamate--tRNA ligase [Candidatus Eremiobacteraeota bacterium]